MGFNRNLTKGQKRTIRKEKSVKPKIFENPRKTIVLHTNKSSGTLKNVLTDIYQLKKESSINFRKKNKIMPFEDITKLEFLSQKNDSSLFCVGTHTKKRPNSITFGRMFDFKLLDMVEFGIDHYEKLTQNVKLGNQQGSKPCLLFQGSEFENFEQHKVLKSLLIDFFKGEEVTRIHLTGLDHVYVFTSVGKDKIYFRHYLIQMKEATNEGCSIDLVDIGPSLDLNIQRTKFASDDLRKLSMRKPQHLMKSKNRNKSEFRNEIGEKMGRLHVKQQPIQEISLRKFNRKQKKKNNGKKNNKKTNDNDK